MQNKFFSVLFFLLLTFWCQGQKRWTLEACIDYALKNNILVKEAELQLLKSSLTVYQDQLARWPTVNFTGNSSYRHGLSENPTTGIIQSSNFFGAGFSLSTGITLFNWFSKQHQLKASQTNEKAEKAMIEKAKNDIILNVYAAFLQVLLTEAIKKESQLQLKLTSVQREVTAKKISKGVFSDLDAREVQLQFINDSLSIVIAQENKEKALVQLKAILNLDQNVDLDVEPLKADQINTLSLVILQPDAVYASASVFLPQVSHMKYQIESALHKIKAVKASRYPTISLFGSASSNYINIASEQSLAFIPEQLTGAKVKVGGISYDVVAPSYKVIGQRRIPFTSQLHSNFGQNIGIGLIVPIFNGGASALNLRREELHLQQLKLQAQQLQDGIQTIIYSTYIAAQAASEKVKLHEAKVKEAEMMLLAAQRRYDLNLLSTQDILTMQNQLQKAKIDLLLEKYDLLFKIKLLEFYKW